MQIELVNRKKWMTYVKLSPAIADCIVNFCNPTRESDQMAV